MKVLIYNKVSGTIESVREFSDDITPSSVFGLVYGGRAAKEMLTKDAIAWEDDVLFNGSQIVDVATSTVVANPNYVEPVVVPEPTPVV